jgi:hypothetical protein
LETLRAFTGTVVVVAWVVVVVAGTDVEVVAGGTVVAGTDIEVVLLVDCPALV